MKKVFCLIFSAALSLGADAAGRVCRTINEGWDFTNEGETVRVDLPHCWNCEDIMDETPGYYRGACRYTRELVFGDELEGREVFLRFKGAGTVASLTVNGTFVGRHAGGYTAFCWDVTGLMVKGSNSISVTVDNSHDPELAPLSADFVFYGGLYRDVELVMTSRQHISLTHFGSSGVYISTPGVSAERSEIDIRTMLSNDSAPVRSLFLEQLIYDPDGKLVASDCRKLKKFAEGKDQEFTQRLEIRDCRLWDVSCPELYRVVTRLRNSSGDVLDEVENPLGLRTFSFDCDKGFFLNGRHVRLMGTNRHQDQAGFGNALTPQMHIRDMRMLKEMGSNYLRISHYPQDPLIPSLCDAYGILASIEIPVVNEITPDSPGFDAGCLSQLREMIFQNYNHPSVVIWAYMNEILHHRPFPKDAPEDVQQKYYDAVHDLAGKLNDECRSLDPYRRTMNVICNDPLERYAKARADRVADILGVNLYSGWYDHDFDYVKTLLEKMRTLFPSKPVILTEYGAGVDPRVHSSTPLQFDYSAEWGRMFHSAYIRNIESLPWLCGSAVWNFNDFFSENRGDAIPHQNNKGLVGSDRVKKNSYDLYRAHLSSEPFSALGDRDWYMRGGNEGQRHRVEAYSNASEVSLYLNGRPAGSRTVVDNVAFWEDVVFEPGENHIRIEASNGTEDGYAFYYEAVPSDMRRFRDMNVNMGSYCSYEDRPGCAVWIPEQEYRPGSWGYVGGRKYNRWYWDGEFRPMFEKDVFGTEDDPLFQTQREGLEAFRADVPDGVYQVILYFAELAFDDAGNAVRHIFEGDHTDVFESGRIFDVCINGEKVLSRFDLLAELGARTAGVRKFTVSVSGGCGLEVRFDAVSGLTAINAIGIHKLI